MPASRAPLAGARLHGSQESRARLTALSKTIPSMNPLDLRRPRALPIRVRSSCFSEWMCRPRSGVLSRARTDGITGFAARGVHGLHENGIHRPARQVRAGVIWVRRAGRVALGTRTLERSAATAPWPDAWVCAAAWLWADVVAANSTAAAARQSASEMWRIGMDMISSVVSLGRGGKSGALSGGAKVRSQRILSKAPWAVDGRRSATRLTREAG